MLAEILTGHTLEEHDERGPIRHAWRAEWSRPNRELERRGQPARTRIPAEAANADEAGDGITGADVVAVSLCGVELPHRVAQDFDPDGPAACEACAALLTAEELEELTTAAAAHRPAAEA